jgi:hypothetical protein
VAAQQLPEPVFVSGCVFVFSGAEESSERADAKHTSCYNLNFGEIDSSTDQTYKMRAQNLGEVVSAVLLHH